MTCAVCERFVLIWMHFGLWKPCDLTSGSFGLSAQVLLILYPHIINCATYGIEEKYKFQINLLFLSRCLIYVTGLTWHWQCFLLCGVQRPVGWMVDAWCLWQISTVTSDYMVCVLEVLLLACQLHCHPSISSSFGLTCKIICFDAQMLIFLWWCWI